MNKYFDSHFNKKVVTLYPGEYYSSSGDELISTVLGSCIAVAFFDNAKLIGGMNHFMLAYDSSAAGGANALQGIGQFGEYSMDLIINNLLEKGSCKGNLSAKVFGGGSVLGVIPKTDMQNVVKSNIDFAFSYLKHESIPVMSSDVGGVYARKIFYDPATSKIWLKRIVLNDIEKENLFNACLPSLKQPKKAAVAAATAGEMRLF